MGLFAAIGALLGVGGGGWAPTPALTALWVVVAVAGAILMNIRNCFCTKACNVLMIILFGVGAALAVITAIVMTHIYITAVNTPLARPDLTDLTKVMGEKTVVTTNVLSVAACVVAVLATFYSARSIFCCGEGVHHS